MLTFDCLSLETCSSWVPRYEGKRWRNDNRAGILWNELILVSWGTIWLCPRSCANSCWFLWRDTSKSYIQKIVRLFMLWVTFFYCRGDHTETTEVEYNPSVTNYSNLLVMFWKNHDSTQKCTRQVWWSLQLVLIIPLPPSELHTHLCKLYSELCHSNEREKWTCKVDTHCTWVLKNPFYSLYT